MNKVYNSNSGKVIATGKRRRIGSAPTGELAKFAKERTIEQKISADMRVLRLRKEVQNG